MTADRRTSAARETGRRRRVRDLPDCRPSCAARRNPNAECVCGELADFRAYFNVADELSDPMTALEDLDARYVREARRSSEALGLSWPPSLADAEEFALSHPEYLRGEEGW